MKVLVIRLSAIGDIVWTSPVVRMIKTQRPDIELHFVTKDIHVPLIAENPYIDEIHVLENKALVPLLKRLRQERYDYILDLHNNLRSWIIKLALFRPFNTFNKHSIQRFFYTRFQWNVMPARHVVQRMIDVAAPLGIKDDDKGLEFYISENDKIPLPFEAGSYIAFVAGASKPTKKLPLSKIMALLSTLQRPIVLVGGKEDIALCEAIVAALPHKIIFSAAGKYSLGASAYLVQQSAYVIGHDTGLTHIAAAFDKPIVSIWGPTSSWGYAPYKAKNILLERPDLECRPCSKSGRAICPRGDHACLVGLTIPENIEEMVEKLM